MNNQTLTIEDVLIGNRLIAELMHDGSKPPQAMFFFLPQISDLCWYEVKEMKFHKSWDWFMPAFKILKQTIARIDRNINHVGRVDEYELEIHFAVQAFNLPKAYRYLVEGAKWCLEHKDLIKPENKKEG